VLKVTDDVQVRPWSAGISAAPPAQPAHVAGRASPRAQCLKYKTDQAADLKKVEKLNALCLSLMGRGLDANPGTRRALASATSPVRPLLSLADVMARAGDLVAAPAAQSGAQKGGGGGGGGGGGKAGSGSGASRGGKAGGRRG
jgi:hypothetical protein